MSYPLELSGETLEHISDELRILETQLTNTPPDEYEDLKNHILVEMSLAESKVKNLPISEEILREAQWNITSLNQTSALELISNMRSDIEKYPAQPLKSKTERILRVIALLSDLSETCLNIFSILLVTSLAGGIIFTAAACVSTWAAILIPLSIIYNASFELAYGCYYLASLCSQKACHKLQSTLDHYRREWRQNLRLVELEHMVQTLKHPGLKAGVREGRAGDLNPDPLSGGDPPRPEERGFPRLDEHVEASHETGATGCFGCFETLEQEPGLGPAGCDCVICKDCKPGFTSSLLDHPQYEPLKCGGCNQELLPRHLRRLSLSDSNHQKLYRHQLSVLLSKIPNWRFCTGADCLNGKQVHEDDFFFLCEVCGKESCLLCDSPKPHKGKCEENKALIEFLAKGKLATANIHDPSHPDYLNGRYRPCYYCGILTEKLDGCDHMKCKNPECRKEWDWSYGFFPQFDQVFRDGMQHYEPLNAPHL